MASMDGKVAVITGAARGVGFGIAQEMAAVGARVVVTDLSQQDVDAAAAQIGPGAEGLTADVTRLESLQAMFAEVIRRHGRLDAVVANAGVGDGAHLDSGRQGVGHPDQHAQPRSHRHPLAPQGVR